MLNDSVQQDNGIEQLRNVRNWITGRYASTLNQIVDHFSEKDYPIENLIDALVREGTVEFDAKYQVIRLK
jgi:hypothetical protein